MKRVRYRKYSWWEDSMIMKFINMTPDNLSYAFKCASEHINRSAKGIEQRYYNHLCNKAPYYSNPRYNSTSELKREEEKSKLTITLGKYSISISER